MSPCCLTSVPRGTRPAWRYQMSTTESSTSAHLLQRVQVAAEHLAKAGVGAGDVVAVKLPTVELIVALLPAWRLGAAATPVNPSLTPTEVDYQLSDSSARARSSPRTRAGS